VHAVGPRDRWRYDGWRIGVGPPDGPADWPAAEVVAEANLTVEQVQDVLVAVAPIVGAPHVLSAAQKITEALGMTL